MILANAGNVVIPAIKALIDLGFEVSKDAKIDSFTATKNGNTFVDEDPVVVLGLVKLYEIRGENWRISDEDLESIGQRYGLF